MKRFLSQCLPLLLMVLNYGCVAPKAILSTTKPQITSLTFLDEYIIPFNFSFQQTNVGGLSGIDYDSASNTYYIISDDRSAINPARFYTAQINIINKKIDTIFFTGVKTFVQPTGAYYPNSMEDADHTPDPEAIRFNSRTNQIIWSSEGERIVGKGKTILEDPAIYVANANGQTLDSFAIPPVLKMQATENGPRQNGVLEGLAIDKNYEFLYAALEEPLYEDGPRADLQDFNTWTRILKFDVKTKKLVAQYAYKLEPVMYAPSPPGAFLINGVSEILWVDKDHLLVMERSFSTGRPSSTIRLFLADLSGATDISNNPSLKITPPLRAITKTLMLNMDDLNRYIDNVEGITFGPLLPNGNQSLIFVTDNNFSDKQLTQILLFEINKK